jgi:hypothetical protein
MTNTQGYWKQPKWLIPKVTQLKQMLHGEKLVNIKNNKPMNEKNKWQRNNIYMQTFVAHDDKEMAIAMITITIKMFHCKLQHTITIVMTMTFSK